MARNGEYLRGGGISLTFDLVFFLYCSALYLAKRRWFTATLKVSLWERWFQASVKSVHLHDRLRTLLFQTEEGSA